MLLLLCDAASTEMSKMSVIPIDKIFVTASTTPSTISFAEPAVTQPREGPCFVATARQQKQHVSLRSCQTRAEAWLA